MPPSRSKKSSKRAKNWAKADKIKADRDKFKEQTRALGSGKIPPSRIQNGVPAPRPPPPPPPTAPVGWGSRSIA